MLRNTAWLLIATASLALSATPIQAAERPNFLWILSEDNSKHYLKLFDEHGAATPNIERLAEHGLVFDHAFSCSPVCSVARTTLITSVYAPRLGTQFHRKIKPVSLPTDWNMFPALLRDAGYYTTNNSKKDYNVIEENGVWHESSRTASWRDRPRKNMPFFHMQSTGISHESSLHFDEQEVAAEQLRTNPAEITVADYHPDTPLFRHTYARYHDRIEQVDQYVGQLIEQLKTDGLLEDTFVFYFGDHGGVLPRSKGYIYESGLHVPLVVRVPERWKHLVDRPLGSHVPGFVSFVDFGPTVLHLAGVAPPGYADGQPFLGAGVDATVVDARDEAFGYADRFDEKYDLCRSLRKGKYKYIRNYQAFYPDALQNNYRYRMLAYQQWRTLYEEGELTGAKRQFFERRDVEQLFDLDEDPYETHNLALDPEYQEVLVDLRQRLTSRLKALPDLSFYPESHLVEQAVAQPIAFGRAHRDEIAQLVEIADLTLQPFQQAEPALRLAVDSNNPWHRYWAMIDCSVFGEAALPLVDEARQLLQDEHLLVRVRAAEFLGSIGAADPRPALMEVLRQSDSSVVTLLTLNTVVFLQDGPQQYQFDIQTEDVRAKKDGVERRLEYLTR